MKINTDRLPEDEDREQYRPRHNSSTPELGFMELVTVIGNQQWDLTMSGVHTYAADNIPAHTLPVVDGVDPHDSCKMVSPKM